MAADAASLSRRRRQCSARRGDAGGRRHGVGVRVDRGRDERPDRVSSGGLPLRAGDVGGDADHGPRRSDGYPARRRGRAGGRLKPARARGRRLERRPVRGGVPLCERRVGPRLAPGSSRSGVAARRDRTHAGGRLDRGRLAVGCRGRVCARGRRRGRMAARPWPVGVRGARVHGARVRPRRQRMVRGQLPRRRFAPGRSVPPRGRRLRPGGHRSRQLGGLSNPVDRLRRGGTRLGGRRPHRRPAVPRRDIGGRLVRVASRGGSRAARQQREAAAARHGALRRVRARRRDGVRGRLRRGPRFRGRDRERSGDLSARRQTARRDRPHAPGAGANRGAPRAPQRLRATG